MKKYKYKLNMLEPGSKMLGAIGICLAVSFVFYICKVTFFCRFFFGLAMLIGFVLWVLLMIESHQDRVLNEQIIEQRRKFGDDYHE